MAGQLARGFWVVQVRFRRMSAAERLLAVQAWAQQMLRILEVDVRSSRALAPDFAGLVVSNHLSWLDILVMQSLHPCTFVAKAEVRRWPLVGSLAAACGTIFVDRGSARSARAMVDATADAIAQGLAVVVFPEGTSSDGQSLGPFHPNIFESAVRTQTPLQWLTLQYWDRQRGVISAAPHFIGDMDLLESLARVTAEPALQARVRVGDPLPSHGHNRRSLAAQAHRQMQAQWQGAADA